MTADILQKASKIIEKAKNDKHFAGDHCDEIIMSGESTADYSLHKFELSEDYFLLLDFSDFSFNDFSIINKSHYEQMKFKDKMEQD